MTQTKVMAVGALENKASGWQSVLNSPNLVVRQCQGGLDALAKLSLTEVDVVISSSHLGDLDPYQFCALIKANPSTRSLPFLILEDADHTDKPQNLSVPLAGPDATITEEKVREDGEAIIKLIEEQAAAGRNRGWKGKTAIILPSASADLSSSEQLQGFALIVKDLLLEKVVGTIAHSLASTIEPRKSFLHLYFELMSILIDCDLKGIAVSSVDNPWLSLKGKAGLSEPALNSLISDITQKLYLTKDPTLDVDIKTAIVQGCELSDKYLLTVPTSSGPGLIVFANYDGRRFKHRELATMAHLNNQMQPVIQLLLAQQQIDNLHLSESYNLSTDQLTGLYNLQFFLGFLQQQLLFSSRQHLPVGLLILDIDNFAAVNSSLGVQFGDSILMKLAAHLLKTTRASDLCARYGGDEFAVVLPNTDLRGAQVLAEKIRLEVEQVPLIEAHDGKAPRLTISAGCAQFDMDDLNPETILRDAKHALQRAKQDGKNRVAI